MRGRYLILTISLFIFVPISIALAEKFQPFKGQVNCDKINIRLDSTVMSVSICQADKGDDLEVVQELYEWFKVRLPKNASAFIKKNFVSISEDKVTRVIKDRVNIRFQATETSAVIGRVNQGEVVNVLADTGEWYKIEPTPDCYGWINKKFITKTKIQIPLKIQEPTPDSATKLFTVEGVIEPYGKIFNRQATHKIITRAQGIFLLKADKKLLNNFNRQKVRVMGRLITDPRQKYPIIETEKVELIN